LRADEFMIREHARQRLGISPEEFVLGTLARLVPLKGIDTAIKASAFALNQSRGWKLLIFGDGKQARALKKLAKELNVGERVEFLGFRSDARGLLPALDVLLFPSRKEAMGMAPAEAMAAGVPVIGSLVGGIPEVVGNTGLLYGAEDVFGFVNGICELYNDPVKRAQLGRAAQCRVQEHFSVKAMVEGVLKVYASAATGKLLV
jgi:glycosyltransferase involved in cell wall biosynthesis